MNEQGDWLNVDDEDFAEKLQEDKELATLFTEKALVVFWKFLEWCKEEGSFMLSAFMLSCLFSSQELLTRTVHFNTNRPFVKNVLFFSCSSPFPYFCSILSMTTLFFMVNPKNRVTCYKNEQVKKKFVYYSCFLGQFVLKNEKKRN
jgi:hypothetical protein